jgi:Tripartite tricarboxylate transporter TctB family
MTIKIQWRDFGAALLTLVIGVGVLSWSLTYSWKEAEFPVVVAVLMIVLSLIDVIAQTDTPLGRAFRRFATAQKVIEWKTEGSEGARASRIVSAILWMLGYVTGLLLIGTLAATPLYVFVYMKLHGGKSLLASGVTAAATTLVIWFAFGILFQYPLFPGLLFGGEF